MLSFETEVMSPSFTKYHIRGLPFVAVLHHFTAPDLGDPHDHPWGFRSVVLSGGYIEHRFDRHMNGAVTEHLRTPGSNFYVAATVIHRIRELLEITGCYNRVQLALHWHGLKWEDR